MRLAERIRRRLIERPLIQLVQAYTLVGPERISNLYALAQRIEKERIPGDVVECGVCNGGTAAVLARGATRSRLGRTLWLFDSFQGMPQTSDKDGPGPNGDLPEAHVGREVGNPERVLEVLRRVGAEMTRVKIMPGWFQETFPHISGSISKIALLNIDADWYESVKLCLDTFYDRVVTGGFISFDDYGHWPGCRRAVDEFFEARRLPYKLQQVDYTAHWFRKE